MRYFDLHCDTLYEMYEKNKGFFGNGLQVSFENAPSFSRYARVMAVWTKAGIPDDEAYERYKKIVSHAVSHTDGRVVFIKTSEEIDRAIDEKKIPVILAVEGASLLGKDLSRLDTLYGDGVKIITLVWKDSDCIGGAWNTDDGLTEFGKDVVRRCAELGIAVDISHASRRTTAETLDLCDKYGARVIATHSNSYSCCAHGRNLTDEEALAVASRGGVIGVSFVPGHLNESGVADVSDIVRHIRRYISLAPGYSICIGSDFDGVVNLPHGIGGEADIKKIRDALISDGIGEDAVEKIFWENAERFFRSIM